MRPPDLPGGNVAYRPEHDPPPKVAPLEVVHALTPRYSPRRQFIKQAELCNRLGGLGRASMARRAHPGRCSLTAQSSGLTVNRAHWGSVSPILLNLTFRCCVAIAL